MSFILAHPVDCCALFSDIYLFAEDAKIFRHILHHDDHQSLQTGVHGLGQWTHRWLLNLNTKKCSVVSFGRDVNKGFIYTIPLEDLHPTPLERADTVRDLG